MMLILISECFIAVDTVYVRIMLRNNTYVIHKIFPLLAEITFYRQSEWCRPNRTRKCIKP